MAILPKFVMTTAGRSAARRFDTATETPGSAQERKLLEIVRRNEDTEYGREYGFRTINNLRDWQRAVPVVDYARIQTRVERVTRGERNVLTAEQPVMFAQTSGTTGDPKYIPVTPTCQGRDHADQMRTWIYHAYRDHPGMFRGNGQVLSLVSPAVEGHTESGVPFGSTSGHIYKHLPWMIRSTYAIPYEVFEIGDYAAKYYVLMRIGLVSNVTFLCTANPSSILKLCETADEHADELIRDIADGTLKRELEIEPDLRAIVEASCRANPARARRLEQARSRRHGKLVPADYWPRLALIGCWKGGTVGSYLERFPEWFFPDRARIIPVRDWGYLSSEARGSIPLSDDGCGGVLTVATNVYEFVSARELEDAPDFPERWNFLGVTELEASKDYYIFVTTTGGLYRYDINDVIRVVDYYNETPVIEFRRKGRGMTSITGEKVSVNQVIEAVESASRALDLPVDHFKAEADLEGARYIFKIEASLGIPENLRRPLLETIEQNLAALNIEYKAKRKSERLKPPLLQVMRRGWYESQKQRDLSSGRRDFQRKTIKLSTRENSFEDYVEATVDLHEKDHP